MKKILAKKVKKVRTPARDSSRGLNKKGGKKSNKTLKKTKMVQKTRTGGKKVTKAGSAETTELDKKSPDRKIVRIMGQGQYIVDNKIVDRLNEIDNSIVSMLGQSDNNIDQEKFRNRLLELSEIVIERGNPLDPKEIVESDIILPSSDISIEYARKLFSGDGIIPEI